jgi:centromeric protein E
LAMELEDERKLRMTLEQHLTEQQKLEAISSDHFTDSIQVYLVEKHGNKS